MLQRQLRERYLHSVVPLPPSLQQYLSLSLRPNLRQWDLLQQCQRVWLGLLCCLFHLSGWHLCLEL